MSEYTKQADDFLSAHSLTFRCVYVGEDCPTHCEDAAKGIELIPGTFPRKNHIHGSHWRLTISGEKRGHITVDFWDSYNSAEIRWTSQNPSKASDVYVAKMFGRGWESLLEKHRKAIKEDRKQLPTAYDMLTCITKSDPYDFESFCGDYGYDEDSRRAESVYRAVVKEWRMVSKFFTTEELDAIQEIN